MKKIPFETEVLRALRGAKAAVWKAVKGSNQLAGQVLAKGRYEEAEALVARARRVKEFEAELDGLRRRWREVRQVAKGRAPEQQPKTPLWAFYQPILRALLEAGGQATRRDLEPVVGRLAADQLQPGDRAPMAGGRERWQVMIQRARKHLVGEGWIEAHPGKPWRITPAGRRAAGRATLKSGAAE